MAYLDLTAANAALKELYDDQKVENLVYEDNPFLALVPKNEEAGGKYIPIPLIYGNSQGRSATFSTAQANQSAALMAEFLLTRKSDYSIATIDNQTMESSMTDKEAFLRMSTVLIDAAIREETNNSSMALFRSGTGSRGRNAGITTGVITLSSPADVVNFSVNQTLQANSSDGGTPRAALGYVIARDVVAGTITVASSGQGGAAATPSGWTTNDYLLVQGDNNALMSGLPAWLPATSPTSSDNFYGVNRSSDSRLYGLYHNGASKMIEEAVIDHSFLLAREGAPIDYFVTNFGSSGALVKALGAKVQYVDLKGPADIGFEAIKIHGAKGVIKVLSDRSCPAQTGFMLSMRTWKLYSLGRVPKILRYADGLEMLRVYNSDSAEVRVGMYGGLASNAPGWNGQTALGA